MSTARTAENLTLSKLAFREILSYNKYKKKRKANTRDNAPERCPAREKTWSELSLSTLL